MSKANYAAIGRAIRAERAERKLTLAQVCEAAECSVAHLSDIERGEVNIPLAMLVKIANVLGVDAKDLMPEPDSRPNAHKEVGGQTLAELAHRIVSHCGDPFLPVSESATSKVLDVLIAVWGDGYKNGRSDRARLGGTE